MAQIIFSINGKEHSIGGQIGPEVSLNDYLRSHANLRGTKSMCHEGGCGACVVAVRAPHPLTKEVKTFAVNSCLVSALSCHGWEITTVEGLGNRKDGYHQIQTRLANFNGTQCGYCTPGWVMNMYSLYESKNKKLSTKEVENSFAGNMCRCTGYRPILDAFKSLATDADQKLLDKVCDLEDIGLFKDCGFKCTKKCLHKARIEENNILGKFNKINIGNTDGEELYLKDGKETNDNRKESLSDSSEGSNWCELGDFDEAMIEIDCGDHKWYKAFSVKDVFDAMKKAKDYMLVAGNTGQGVYHITSFPQTLIDISSVQDLKTRQVNDNLILGAGLSLAEMMDYFLEVSSKNEDFSYLKEFYDHMDLVAHIPVRNIGTIGGNLSLKHQHNDFQSDVFLIFETVGATMTLLDGSENAQIELRMTEYLKTDMRGKLIYNVKLPPQSHRCCLVKTYKIMPRSQNAHAIVNAGFMFKYDTDMKKIENANIVFGSISSTFVHATNTEAALTGKDIFTDATLQLALTTLANEIFPEPAPAEPSPAYRKMLAISLFYKAILSLCPEGRMNPRMKSGGSVLTTARPVSKGTQSFDTDKSLWPLNQPIPKIEALVQCSGEATYANDLPTQPNEVFASFVCSTVVTGKIKSIDTSEAMKLDGVLAFYSAKDIPGTNTFTPSSVPLMIVNEEIFCSGDVKYYAQPLGVIVANNEKTANRAAKLVKVSYTSDANYKPILTIDNALKSPEKASRVVKNATMEPKDRGQDVRTIINGEYKVDAQFHYFMETQTSVAVPTEDGLEVHSSTQWLDLTAVAIAECLKIPVNQVNVIVRRVGGAYGGKITRSCQAACAAALVAHLRQTTCRVIVPLQTSMAAIGKRLPTMCGFEVGLSKEGEIQYLKNTFYQDNGITHNETIAPLTMEHFTNCYAHDRWFVEANSVLTDTPSNTWCRAPGSTEGIAMIEYIMERIAYCTKKDPIEVRLLNMPKTDNPIPEMIDILKKDADYDNRMVEITTFNNENRWRKRALKMVPMQYGLFYFGNFSAIVNIYHADGSVVVIHGGIEMGQGINTKVAQVVAHFLGIALNKVSVKPSSSFVTPNAMTTGGSIGSESVAYAAMTACKELLGRLAPIKQKMTNPSWEELVRKAYLLGVDLQASYMFTAKDAKNYQIFGVTALEVEVDILSGNHQVRRVDLLEDTGQSLSPEVDIGQIEGAFIMGLGYWTSEHLMYDTNTGQLLTDRTWTYKPPGVKDIPLDMRIYFKRRSFNSEGVLRSKATGEPSFCMAVVVTHALREAVKAATTEAGEAPDRWVEIPNPCTAENIFMAVRHKIEDFKLN